MISLTSFEITSMCLIITAAILWYWNKNRNLPPGPNGLPFFGYYPFLSKSHYADFTKLAEKYGNVFSFRTVGGTLIVVLNGIDAIRNVLVKRAEEFIGRPIEDNTLSWISDGLGVTQEEGEPWKEHRRFFLQTAKSFGFGKQLSEDFLHKEMVTLRDALTKSDGKPCDFKFHIAYAVNSVVCQLLFSKKFQKNEQFKDIADSASALVEMFADERGMLVGIPYQLYMLYSPTNKRIRKAREHFRKLVKDILDEHIETFDPNNLRDYVDGFLHQAYKLKESGCTDHSFINKRLSSVTLNMMMEGTESVGGTICVLLDEACKHLPEQKLVQEELDSVVGTERLPSWLDRQNLPYLEAFILELYRHNMPFNVSTMYCNFNSTSIEGFRIPRRTIIVANLYSVNKDPILYPEPEKFNPKRFLDENGRRKKSEGPYPFGIGKRNCIGESLAQMEVFVVIASILQKFTLYPTGKSSVYKPIIRI